MTIPSNSSAPCPACGEATAHDARFCAHCGASLATVAGGAERRVITVLFADLTGFTQLTEQLDPEEVRDFVAGCLDPLCDCVTRWGGYVDKFIGDCVMALFGAPVAYENEPERAVRAALDMHEALDAMSAEVATGAIAHILDGGYRPRLRIGVATGPVVTGVFSGGGARNYTAVGDTVNVAARLQGQGDPGRVLVDHATYSGARHAVAFTDEQVVHVKGRTEPVRTRYALEARTDRGQIRGAHESRPPLVGRTRELETLRRLWADVNEGHSRICLVAGPPGIGKSRLVEELIACDEIPADSVVRGRSYPYASSTSWEPLAEILRDLHGVSHELAPGEVSDRIAADSPVPWEPAEVEALQAAFGASAADIDALAVLGPAERADRVSGLVHRALAPAGGEPRLVVLEDLHWADAATLQFVATMEEIHGPVLFLLISRPPLPTETLLAEALGNVQVTVPLQPLSDVESRDLLDHVLGDHRLSPDFLDRMVDCADGNPLFLEEITKSMLDREILVREEGFLVATRSSEDLHVPDSIESLLSSRLDGLDAEAKRVLQYAAIVGRRFWSGVVSDALAGRPIDKELDQLRSGALVRSQDSSAIRGDHEFVFEHLMMQEVAYQGLLRGLRSELHTAVGEWLEKNVGAAEYADWIAYHFERSTQSDRALPYLEEAAERAMQQGAMMDADALVNRALATDPRPDARARLLGLRESVATAGGNVDGRLAAIEELESLAGAEDDRALAADAAHRRSRLQLDAGELEAARASAGRALEGFGELGDGSREADTHRVLGRIEHQWGRYREATDHYEASLELERAAGDRFGEAETLDCLGLVEIDTGRFVAGLERFVEARGISLELDNAALEARVLSHAATARRWLGDLVGAEQMATEARELARRCGSRRALASADFTQGHILAAAGRNEEALALIQGTVDAAQTLARHGLESRARLELAGLETGEAAVASGTAAIEAAREAGLVHIEILALTRLAELALEADKLGEADEHSALAVTLLREHGNIQGPEEAVFYTRARVLEGLGRTEDAERPLSEARAAVQLKAVWITDDADRERFLSLGLNPAIMGAAE